MEYYLGGGASTGSGRYSLHAGEYQASQECYVFPSKSNRARPTTVTNGDHRSDVSDPSSCALRIRYLCAGYLLCCLQRPCALPSVARQSNVQSAEMDWQNSSGYSSSYSKYHLISRWQKTHLFEVYGDLRRASNQNDNKTLDSQSGPDQSLWYDSC